MSGPKTMIVPYLSYEDLFGEVRKGSLIIPITCLSNSKNIDDLICDLIKNYDSVEAISYSSFLNAVTQTCDADETLSLAIKEIECLNLTQRLHNSGILFHRDNLLYFISQIIQKPKNSQLRITGQGNSRNAKDYYKSLLLISSKLNMAEGNKKHTILKDYFVRAYPHYYSPETSFAIYSKRIQRYWYIYSEILKNTDTQNNICDGIKIIEQKTKISLKEHFTVVRQILMWFLQIPLEKKAAKCETLKNVGFNYRDINTFYINKDRFADYEAFIKLIDHLSVDLGEMKRKFSDAKRKDKIKGFYEYFRNFFDRPVFRIDKKNYCIIDLKFLIEGVCSGFIWHLNDLSPVKFEQIKDQYGLLLEEYFIFLVKKIFKGILITNRKPGQPDAILEFDDYIIIFEFTTEYYRFASLYDTKTENFLEDLYKMFFNLGRSDKRGRGKKDKGKFLKLEAYIAASKNRDKKILPVIITENYIGDYDLINEFDSFMELEISNRELIHLKKHKPLIINLDDLETFWAFSDFTEAGRQFVQYVQSWEKSEKGSFYYNLSYFMSEQVAISIENSEYKGFFNFGKFLVQ